jgi:hypothetical protein
MLKAHEKVRDVGETAISSWQLYLGSSDIRRNFMNAYDLGVVVVELGVLASRSFAVTLAAEESGLTVSLTGKRLCQSENFTS